MSHWEGSAEAYSRSFATLCGGAIPVLLDATRDAGPRHLDVGCGDGGLAHRARTAGRHVVAVEAEREMAARARALTHVPVIEAALPRLPCAPGTFDVVTANFVVNHLDDPRAGVRELLRVTRRTGRVAMSVWPPDGAGWTDLVGGVFRDARVTPPPSTRLPEHLDFDRSPAGFGRMVAEVGGAVEHAQSVTWTWRVSPDDLWAGIAGGIATPGATYLAQTAPVRRRVESIFARRAREQADASGQLSFVCRASVVLARRR